MALAQEDLNVIKQEIGLYVKENISAWLAEQSLGKPPVVYEIELRERMVRVEDELKNQRELMREGFNQMEKRFELMQASMDKRFEQVGKRFEQVDKRFEQIDKRLELMQADMDKRSEQVDKRFESVQQEIRTLQLRMDHFMRWSFGVIMGTGGLIVGILKLWP
jgi:DNA repair exonuclease SbcCD ATPase subunit